MMEYVRKVNKRSQTDQFILQGQLGQSDCVQAGENGSLKICIQEKNFLCRFLVSGENSQSTVHLGKEPS